MTATDYQDRATKQFKKEYGTKHHELILLHLTGDMSSLLIRCILRIGIFRQGDIDPKTIFKGQIQKPLGLFLYTCCAMSGCWEGFISFERAEEWTERNKDLTIQGLLGEMCASVSGYLTRIDYFDIGEVTVQPPFNAAFALCDKLEIDPYLLLDGASY